MSTPRFAKGHGTGNDFVLLIDEEGEFKLSPDLVARICDRRFGIGGDGLLRIVRSKNLNEPNVGSGAEWFMDYRNADGSVAEMCGNGARVFAKFLHSTDRVDSAQFKIGTRGGDRVVEIRGHEIAVDMGKAEVNGEVSVEMGTSWQATAISVPNPHAVIAVERLAQLPSEFSQPTWAPVSVFPNDANFEWYEVLGEQHVRMRVFERGVGETLSCGTGACAVAVAARLAAGVAASTETTWRVELPGGRLHVEQSADGELKLIGPAEIVATGIFTHEFWK